MSVIFVDHLVEVSVVPAFGRELSSNASTVVIDPAGAGDSDSVTRAIDEEDAAAWRLVTRIWAADWDSEEDDAYRLSR